jgi:oligopeptide/dipeptide ABC transporter ATP-binding protein
MQPLLCVQGLRMWFPKNTSFFGNVRSWVKAVDDVTFTLMPGRTLGLVGESGSGKTTTGLAVMRAIRPRAGSIRFSPDGQAVHELTDLSAKEMRPLRRHMQMIFQDPFSSLNPRMTVLKLIAEPLKVNRVGDARQRREKVKALLGEVGLSPAFINRYPHAFSGGQRQRLAIARALALSPSLIVCDEPLSALDVSVQAQTINLMIDLRARHRLAYLFISHDLHVVKHICDDVAVMYAGRLVERGPKEKVYSTPLHPYTQELLASAPKADPRARRDRRPLAGEAPDPSNLPPGCVFHPRCPRAMPACSTVVPAVTRVDDRDVRCLLYEDIANR